MSRVPQYADLHWHQHHCATLENVRHLSADVLIRRPSCEPWALSVRMRSILVALFAVSCVLAQQPVSFICITQCSLLTTIWIGMGSVWVYCYLDIRRNNKVCSSSRWWHWLEYVYDYARVARPSWHSSTAGGTTCVSGCVCTPLNDCEYSWPYIPIILLTFPSRLLTVSPWDCYHNHNHKFIRTDSYNCT